MNEQALNIKNLNIDYVLRNGRKRAVQNVSFEIKKGEIFGLVGESGSGKSTIVQAIMRTLPPPAIITNGQIEIEGIDVLSLSPSSVREYRWKKISIVMQSALNALNPVMTVSEQIKDVIWVHQKIKGEKANKKVRNLLELVDVPTENAQSYPISFLVE